VFVVSITYGRHLPSHFGRTRRTRKLSAMAPAIHHHRQHNLGVPAQARQPPPQAFFSALLEIAAIGELRRLSFLIPVNLGYVLGWVTGP
jgi:hypothetical protein